MLGFEDVNNAVSRFGAGIGGAIDEFGKAQTAQRAGYKQKGVAALSQGNVAEAIKYLRLADPSSTVADQLKHATSDQVSAVPGAVNPVAGLPTTVTADAPTPALAPKAVPTWQRPTAQTAADLPTTLTPGIGSMPAPGDLAAKATEAFTPQPKHMGVNPRRIGLGDGYVETVTETKDLGVDFGNRDNITAIAAALGMQKPDPKYSEVGGHGLVEITPAFAGLPAETKVVLAEKLGLKDLAGLKLDAAKLNLSAAEINARLKMAEREDGTRRWIATLGDNTDRWKATLAAKVKEGSMSDDQARAVAALAEVAIKTQPRKTDAMGKYTETEEEYAARFLPTLNAYLSVAGVKLPDLDGLAPKTAPAQPAAPGAPAPPSPAPAGGWNLPSLPDLGNVFGGRPAAPAPRGTTPPAKVPPAPVAPTMKATAAATKTSQQAVAAGEQFAALVRAKAPFAKVKSVNPTTGDVILDYDPKKLTPQQRRALEDLDQNAILFEEPGQPPRLQVLGAPVSAPPAAPAQPAAKPTPNGATPRMQQLLNQTKPRD